MAVFHCFFKSLHAVSLDRGDNTIGCPRRMHLASSYCLLRAIEESSKILGVPSTTASQQPGVRCLSHAVYEYRVLFNRPGLDILNHQFVYVYSMRRVVCATKLARRRLHRSIVVACGMFCESDSYRSCLALLLLLPCLQWLKSRLRVIIQCFCQPKGYITTTYLVLIWLISCPMPTFRFPALRFLSLSFPVISRIGLILVPHSTLPWKAVLHISSVLDVLILKVSGNRVSTPQP